MTDAVILPAEAVQQIEAVFHRSTGHNAVVLYQALAQAKPPDEQDFARAWTEAGYMETDAYLRLCHERGWTSAAPG